MSACPKTNTTVFGRLNKITDPLVTFEVKPEQKVFNTDRKCAVKVKDSMIDPH